MFTYASEIHQVSKVGVSKLISSPVLAYGRISFDTFTLTLPNRFPIIQVIEKNQCAIYNT